MNEVCKIDQNGNRVKKNQRHDATQQTRNQICIQIYLIRANISVCKTDLLQVNTNQLKVRQLQVGKMAMPNCPRGPHVTLFKTA